MNEVQAVERKKRGLFSRLGSLPTACLIVTAISALYMLLVAIGNVTDFDTNFALVQHVLSMDTTNFGAAPGESLDPDVMWRAVTDNGVHTVAYILIIAWETMSAVVLLLATGKWIGALRSGDHDEARRLSTVGFLMIVVLYMGGFIAIGGEWFEMWRSVAWNGLEPAFRDAVLALFGLVLVNLPSMDWNCA